MSRHSKRISLKTDKQSRNLRQEYTFCAGPYKIALGRPTRIMGIINCTPDSFSLDGCLKKGSILNSSLRLARKMTKEGADILDVGGESSRPGAKRISVKEEIKRIIPTISKLAQSTDTPISVDTYKSEVAKQALDSGAVIVNNINGLNPTKALLTMVRNYNAGIILMHMQGVPRTMQKTISYGSMIDEIISGLRNSIEKCLEIGIKSDRIIIDPGIGFGKTVENNFTILNQLEDFKVLRKPLLIGTSRKSFIGKALNVDVDKRLYGSLASVSASIMKGAHIVRVHDVKETKQTARIIDAILNS